MGRTDSGSQSVDPRLPALPPSGNLVEMLILRPHPDLQNQILWGWGPASCVYKVPGDSEAQWSLRNSVIKY